MLAGPAAAQDRPVFPPTHDVAVSYRLTTSQPNTPPSLQVRYSTHADRLRVEGSLGNGGLPGYVLVDRKSRHAVIVMEQLGMMMDAPPRAGLDQALVLENGRNFTRRGTDIVAGLRCTVWDVAGEAASGTACVTGDGVVLRADGHDRHGRTASLEATEVEYAPQPQALFFPPANVRKVEIAAGPAAAALERLRGRQQ